MPRDVDLADAASRIETCVSDCEDDVVDRESNADGITNEWRLERGHYNYYVVAQPNGDYFKAEFGHNIIATIASVLEDDDAQRVLDAAGVSADDVDDVSPEVVAASILLDDTPNDIRTSFANDLIQLLSFPGVTFDFETTESGTISTFVVEKRIYPFSDEFTFREFDQATCTVISLGHAATVYTQICLDIESALAEHEPEKPTPYIQ